MGAISWFASEVLRIRRYLRLRTSVSKVDLGAVFDLPAIVHRVLLQGATLTIPPGSIRPAHSAPGSGAASKQGGFVAQEVILKDFQLVVLPKTQGKEPLTFDVSDLHLKSVGKAQPVEYDAVLMNPKPRGLVQSKGVFGPWSTEDPGSTPITGSYSFERADLSVFSAIAGVLNFTGKFTGTLSAIHVEGEASVPDLRLKSAGNPMMLSPNFEVLDGRNGDTILEARSRKVGQYFIRNQRRHCSPERRIAAHHRAECGNGARSVRFKGKRFAVTRGPIRRGFPTRDFGPA